jgi:lipoic acid synthetase
MPAGKRPDWFHVPAPVAAPGSTFEAVKESVRDLKLATVCEEAQCPNIGECWSGGTGTIMVLGDTCTRGCKFCAVNTDATPAPPDEQEPWNTAEAISRWGVNYVVITSVDRDDLPDGGASHFARTVELSKLMKPDLLLECLVSDFQGDAAAIHAVASSPLDVYAHNVETVERLTPFVRDRRADYRQSLRALAEAKRAPRGDFVVSATAEANHEGVAVSAPLQPLYTKTSLMLGLGETKEEVLRCMADIRAAGVDVLTLGQYLRPTERHLAVVEFVTPEAFEDYRRAALDMGFSYCAAGPLVRSSYKAGEFFLEHLLADPDSKPCPPPPRDHPVLLGGGKERRR